MSELIGEWWGYKTLYLMSIDFKLNVYQNLVWMVDSRIIELLNMWLRLPFSRLVWVGHIFLICLDPSNVKGKNGNYPYQG